MNAYIVLDLGFGDSGKGHLTDFLVRHTGATIVVRYNGGAQAGHNVVTPEGVHHTFAQFGAGSFVPGVRTFLSRHVVIHPTALLVEARVLEEKGVPNVFGRIRISERALVTTPFHQAVGRIRELARGAARHGSCGVGVGETIKDALEHAEDVIVAGDLRNATTLGHKVRWLRERKCDQMRALVAATAENPRLDREIAVIESDAVGQTWIEQATSIAKLGLVVSDATLAAWMARADSVVFEGAQGVLLDEWFGFHPYTSWSSSTPANALELLSEYAPGASIERIGILRSYLLRHGPGPLPTETNALRAAVFDHNRDNEWQGPVRYGWPDMVLTRYALDSVRGLDTIGLTHLDVVGRMPTWRVCAGYRLTPRQPDAELVAEHTAQGLVTRLVAPQGRSLDRQARLAEMLSHATAVFEDCKPNEDAVLHLVERLLGRNVGIVSRGPRAKDVSFRRRIIPPSRMFRSPKYDVIPKTGQGVK